MWETNATKEETALYKWPMLFSYQERLQPSGHMHAAESIQAVALPTLQKRIREGYKSVK